MSKLSYRRYWHSRVWQRESTCSGTFWGEKKSLLFGEKKKKRWLPLVRTRQQNRMNPMPASQQGPYMCDILDALRLRL